MRLQFEGTYSLEEFEDAISTILKDFKSSNIDSLRSINIYVQPCVKGRVTRLSNGGEEIEHVIFGLPHPQEVSLSSENLTVVPSYKSLSQSDSYEKKRCQMSERQNK